MSIITCEECTKEYSDKASACPNCGNPTNDNAPKPQSETHQNNAISDIEGPKVQTVTKGSLTNSSSGKLRLNSGIFEVKGLLLTNQLGDLSSLTSIAYKAKNKKKVHFVFSGKTIVIKSQASLEPFISSFANNASINVHDDIDSFTLMGVAKVFLGVVFALIIIGTFASKDKNTNNANTPITSAKARKATKYILKPIANIRAGASTKKAIISKLKWGTPITVIKTSGDWNEITFTDGGKTLNGWVSTSVISDKQPPALVKGSCSSVVKKFEGASRYSDLQKDEMWKKYDGKVVQWSVFFQNVDKQTFSNDLTVSYNCTTNPYQIAHDLSVDYPESYRESLLSSNKNDRYSETILLKSRVGGTLFGEVYE